MRRIGKSDWTTGASAHPAATASEVTNTPQRTRDGRMEPPGRGGYEVPELRARLLRPGEPGDAERYGVGQASATRPDERHRAVEHLVAAGADAGDRGPYLDVGNETDALELSSVGMAHVVAAEGHRDAVGQRQVGDVAVRASGLRADELGAVGGL